MQIIREIMPHGLPIVMDARVSDDGRILPKTIRIFPLQPADSNSMGIDASAKAHEAIPVLDPIQHRKLAKRFNSYLLQG